VPGTGEAADEALAAQVPGTGEAADEALAAQVPGAGEAADEALAAQVSAGGRGDVSSGSSPAIGNVGGRYYYRINAGGLADYLDKDGG